MFQAGGTMVVTDDHRCECFVPRYGDAERERGRRTVVNILARSHFRLEARCTFSRTIDAIRFPVSGSTYSPLSLDSSRAAKRRKKKKNRKDFQTDRGQRPPPTIILEIGTWRLERARRRSALFGGRRFERRATRQQQVVVGRWRTVRSCHFRSRHVGPRRGRDEWDGRTGFWRGTLPVRGETTRSITITSTTIGHNLLHHLLGSSLARVLYVCVCMYMCTRVCIRVGRPCTRARARARVRGRVSLSRRGEV